MTPRFLMLFTTLFTTLVLATTASAQIHVGVGAAVGLQSYENPNDDPRPLVSGDLLVWRGALRASLAVDYTSVSDSGGLAATHADVVYRHAFGRNTFLIGAGPTFVRGKTGSDTVFNVQAELSRAFDRMELLVRVRQYDFEIRGSRNNLGTTSPAVYVGGRYNFR